MYKMYLKLRKCLYIRLKNKEAALIEKILKISAQLSFKFYLFKINKSIIQEAKILYLVYNNYSSVYWDYELNRRIFKKNSFKFSNSLSLKNITFTETENTK